MKAPKQLKPSVIPSLASMKLYADSNEIVVATSLQLFDSSMQQNDKVLKKILKWKEDRIDEDPCLQECDKMMIEDWIARRNNGVHSYLAFWDTFGIRTKFALNHWKCHDVFFEECCGSLVRLPLIDVLPCGGRSVKAKPGTRLTECIQTTPWCTNSRSRRNGTCLQPWASPPRCTRSMVQAYNKHQQQKKILRPSAAPSVVFESEVKG